MALLKYPREPEGEEKPPTDLVQRLARQGPYHSGALEAAQMVISGLFERFPKLQVYWAENNVGWLPYYYEQIDHEYEVNRFWAERHLGLKRLKNRPSEYLREHAYWGSSRTVQGSGSGTRSAWTACSGSTDFPHLVTRWPHSLEYFEMQTEGLPEEEKYLLAAGNAMRFFGLG